MEYFNFKHKLSLLILLLTLFQGAPLLANSEGDEGNSNTTNEILLIGELNTQEEEKIHALKVEANAEKRFLLLDFAEALGNLQLRIVANTGTEVYNASHPINQAQQLNINLDTAPAGQYTLYIQDAQGGMLYGKFSLYPPNAN